MKLPRIRAEVPPARMRVTLPGMLKVTLEQYAAYYRNQYGDAVSLEELIPEILQTFVSSDREFRCWQQDHSAETSTAQPLSVAELSPTKTTHANARDARDSLVAPHGSARQEEES